MLLFDGEPEMRLMYTAKQIKKMCEAWFFVGAAVGVLMTIATCLTVLKVKLG